MRSRGAEEQRSRGDEEKNIPPRAGVAHPCTPRAGVAHPRSPALLSLLSFLGISFLSSISIGCLLGRG